MTTSPTKPVLAVGLGDPVGISPKLTAKPMANAETRAAANHIVIGTLREHAAGTDAGTLTPFNKFAMRQTLPGYDDEIDAISEETGAIEGGRDFNVLENDWNARAASPVPLREVADHISTQAVVNSNELVDSCMMKASFANPRIAFAGPNPHAGDNGNFGREEIDIIEPAEKKAPALGLPVEGPFPSDGVFRRAQRVEFDAGRTMYHDQRQIAVKTMGFDRGITLIGGYAFASCTQAHGTTYDIAGNGASRKAILIAARMARPHVIDSAARAEKLNAMAAATRARAA